MALAMGMVSINLIGTSTSSSLLAHGTSPLPDQALVYADVTILTVVYSLDLITYQAATHISGDTPLLDSHPRLSVLFPRPSTGIKSRSSARDLSLPSIARSIMRRSALHPSLPVLRPSTTLADTRRATTAFSFNSPSPGRSSRRSWRSEVHNAG
ncbi:hypothetical protein D9611_014295 [Ephemerocybe angulata]|uniref:Uncharacterized protein n=1 Tax=Ephemerocybe angulata TaxID=980116 RepID=A0A8H5BT73_9AGAR|nr:hypothetical protein D9611_014295 [Tulosesus angulatus]